MTAVLEKALIRGFWEVKLFDKDGYLKRHINGENVITTVGKEYLARYLNSAATAASTNTVRYIAIGSNQTAESASDTALGTELARVSGTVSYVSGAIFEVIGSFGAGVGTGSIYEYGLLTTSSGGTLFSRDTEALITKGASDTMIVTTRVTFS